jgi:phospholipid/cholesterol/gamma-HCH transport system ATP-binding protein
MITHDLDLLWQVADRVAVLADGKVQDVGSMAELAKSDKPAVRAFFDGPRARAAATQAGDKTADLTGEATSKPK